MRLQGLHAYIERPGFAGHETIPPLAVYEKDEGTMSHDIRHILDNWDYDPSKSYRKIMGDNGREKVQVRVDNAAFQGVLQMELDGRPDGRQPYGYDFVLDYYMQALQRFERAHGTKRGFELDEENCEELFDESLRIYNRYVFLLQLQDYPRVVRDTKRNMELFRFVNTYARREEDRHKLERWWPYIIRINATARGASGDGGEPGLRLGPSDSKRGHRAN